ncbi:MFS transporter [Paenibacillus sp. MSJ-34]|nr:MFS transporter [Paenibacillus sp. MSJ-34]MBU5442082.1 MFS transporter [Paenibacillus sp. MSJ-34]
MAFITSGRLGASLFLRAARSESLVKRKEHQALSQPSLQQHTDARIMSGGAPETYWLSAFMFSIFMSTSLVTNFFPLYYDRLGFSSVQIGFLYSLGPLVSIFSNLLWGLASDRYRTIKKVLILLLAGQLLMGVLLSQSTAFAVVCIVIMLFYFFFYPIYPLSDNFAILTMQRYGKSFIGIRVWGSIGFACASVIFGFLFQQFGSHTTIWVSIALSAISLSIVFTVKDKSGSAKKVEFSGLLNVLRQREVIWFFAFILCLAIAHRMNEAFFSLSLRHLGANESVIGWSLMVSSLSEIPIFLLLNKYGQKFKELPLLAFAAVMYGLRFLLMSLTQDPYRAIAIQSMHSVTFGVAYFTSVRYITQIIPIEYRSTGLALYTVMWSSVSGLISGMFGGALYGAVGKDTFYSTAMVLAFLAAAGFMGRHLFAREKI